MEPVTTTIVTAFAIGVAKGATNVGEQAVTDAYAAFKHVVTTAYEKANDLIEAIARFERRPDSAARRAAVAEELRMAGALDNQELLSAAEAVLTAAENSKMVLNVGVDWQDVKVARVKIGKIRARAGAIGWRAARVEITESFEIESIDVGQHLGK